MSEISVGALVVGDTFEWAGQPATVEGIEIRISKRSGRRLNVTTPTGEHNLHYYDDELVTVVQPPSTARNARNEGDGE